MIIYCVHIFELDFDILLSKIVQYCVSYDIEMPSFVIVLWRVGIVLALSLFFHKAKRLFSFQLFSIKK